MTESFGRRVERVKKAQTASFVVSPDDYRVGGDGVYRFDPGLEPGVWFSAHGTFAALLSRADVSKAVMLVGVPGAGKSTWLAAHKKPGVVYFDATMVQARSRADLIKIARQARKPIEAIVLATPLEECLQRNRNRSQDRFVPEDRIREMAASLSTMPPVLSEGFSDIRQA
jgi:hypothetical protein